ncbi:GDCCVxC domain-containing (seleno)protein [Fodinibius roseus]|uniref:GDCCVxC domain-containing (seleno)protein n=1 Tax=Fodinibius roseus TaxID=1194090 RepID=UPI003314039C
MSMITRESTITCSNCSLKTTETMPTDSCQFFWECPNCGEVLKAGEGDCCVFCTYGDTSCPPIQQEQDCC